MKGREPKMHETNTISEFEAARLRLLGTLKKTEKSILVRRKDAPIALATPPPKPERRQGLHEGSHQGHR